MRMKVCGATRAGEVERLAGAGVDLVGLWHGVPRGHAELRLAALTELAAAAGTGRPRPVMVTLEANVDTIGEVVARSGIQWVQLHGYQQPALVRALKDASPDLTVVKALHVRDGTCVEQPLIGAYERSGVDIFLLDTLSHGGKIGSTAQPLDPRAVAGLAELISRPFILAGGLTVHNAHRFGFLAGHPRFFGIDVDSATRGPDGRIDPARVVAIRRSWTALEVAR